MIQLIGGPLNGKQVASLGGAFKARISLAGDGRWMIYLFQAVQIHGRIYTAMGFVGYSANLAWKKCQKRARRAICRAIANGSLLEYSQ